MNPKLIQKLSLEADSYVTITWKGFPTVFQVLSTSILAFGRAKGSKQEGAPCTFSNTRNLSCLNSLSTTCPRLTSAARNQLLEISMKSSAKGGKARKPLNRGSQSPTKKEIKLFHMVVARVKVSEKSLFHFARLRTKFRKNA